MNVTQITSRTVKTYALTIEDGEVRPQPYSRVGARYQVDHVEVIKRDGNVGSVHLSGSVLKKDGSVGKNRASERLHRQGTWPDWVHSMVAGLA
jgi:hypothetical protein